MNPPEVTKLKQAFKEMGIKEDRIEDEFEDRCEALIDQLKTVAEQARVYMKAEGLETKIVMHKLMNKNFSDDDARKLFELGEQQKAGYESIEKSYNALVDKVNGVTFRYEEDRAALITFLTTAKEAINEAVRYVPYEMNLKEPPVGPAQPAVAKESALSFAKEEIQVSPKRSGLTEAFAKSAPPTTQMSLDEAEQVQTRPRSGK